ncbi:MAG: alpha/beta hydrolase [Spirochaetia bacterium]|nr:alpha/beta hydrolase [Spirochaetia bacterium]
MQITRVTALLLLVISCMSVPEKQPVQALQDLVYAERGDTVLLADVFLPSGPGPFPAVLLLHSGSWRRGSKARMRLVGEEFARQGIVAVAANYRLSPAARFPAQIYDCRDALRWMRSHASTFHIRPDSIGVLGYSAGGHLALLLGLSGNEHRQEFANVKAIATAGAPADLTDLIGNPMVSDLLGGSKGAKPQVYKMASPVSYVTSDDPPVLLMHGAYDWIVPNHQSQQIAAELKAKGVPVEYYELPMGHVRTTTGFNATEVAIAIDFFKRKL